MNKEMTITVSLSTNPQVEGRYFIDIRDTTGGRNRQMTTRVRDHKPALRFIEDVKAEAVKHNVTVKVAIEAHDFIY
jgi:hypothetical protein